MCQLHVPVFLCAAVVQIYGFLTSINLFVLACSDVFLMSITINIRYHHAIMRALERKAHHKSGWVGCGCPSRPLYIPQLPKHVMVSESDP